MKKGKNENSMPKSSVMKMPASLVDSKTKMHIKGGGKSAKSMGSKGSYKKPC